MAVQLTGRHVAARPGINIEPPLRLAIATRFNAGAVDGIHDHGVRLREALHAHGGATVRMCERRSDGGWRSDDGCDAPDLAGAVRGCDAVLLQYNPFLYGRWGVAPWLAEQLTRIRRGGARTAVMVHETAMPLRGVRSSAMGVWQRAQLRAVVAAADAVFVSIEPWRDRIARFRPRREVRHLPVGSNLPDMSQLRERSRARLGIAPGDVAVATLSTGHPSHLVEPVRDAVNALAESGMRVTLLRLGAGATEVEGLRGAVRVYRPGRRPAADLAADLAAADIALMPYVDGVSTRRTGLMAALQHGVAVVGSDGPLTDPLLRANLPLVSLDAMPRAAVDMALHQATRAAIAETGRRLYAERFDWGVLARSLLEVLDHKPRAARVVHLSR